MGHSGEILRRIIRFIDKITAIINLVKYCFHFQVHATIIGVASRGCEGFNNPGIFTRIKPVVPWIKEAVKQDLAEAPTIESKVLKLCRAIVQDPEGCSINNRIIERGYIYYLGIDRSKLIKAIKDEFGVKVCRT